MPSDIERQLDGLDRVLALRKLKLKIGHKDGKAKKLDTKGQLRLTLERVIQSITNSDHTKEQRLELLKKFHQHLLWFEERGLN